MGVYNFKPQFVPCIEIGAKQHTIRAPRKDGYLDKPGILCHLYTGLRTRASRRIGIAPCVRVEPIMICVSGIRIADAELDATELDLFAWRDGFRFEEAHRQLHAPRRSSEVNGLFAKVMLAFWKGGLPFSGNITYWSWKDRVK